MSRPYDYAAEIDDARNHSTYTDDTPSPDDLAELEAEHHAEVERNRAREYEEEQG